MLILAALYRAYQTSKARKLKREIEEGLEKIANEINSDAVFKREPRYQKDDSYIDLKEFLRLPYQEQRLYRRIDERDNISP